MQDSTSISELVCLQQPFLFTILAFQRRAASVPITVLPNFNRRTMQV